jgi:putative Ca2+/H+ antiporter (TMEM165/GDT1 family)
MQSLLISATVVLSAHYQPLWQVIAGTTLGMLAANVPVVYLEANFTQRLPLRILHRASSLMFATLGLWVLVSPAF